MAPDHGTAVNPFHLPGAEHSPLLPLSPWSDPRHKTYYVAINHTQDAYDAFVKAMGDLSWLQADGRLILAAGESGCGKTSLINRCVAWLEENLRAHYRKAVIIDLTPEAPTIGGHTVNERIHVVCARLTDELARQKALDAEQLVQLQSRLGDPTLFFPWLAGELPDDQVLLLLLPPSELLEEVYRYMGLARKKILVFAESSDLDETQIRNLERGAWPRVPPIVMWVGPLRSGDVERFAADRLGRAKGTHPKMTTDTLRKVAGPLRSIAMLQRILAGVYEDRLHREQRYSATDTVTYEDITEFVYRDLLREPGLNP